jgi:hypothetical protein
MQRSRDATADPPSLINALVGGREPAAVFQRRAPRERFLAGPPERVGRASGRHG